MLENPIITLTTDFGLKDPFVGIMKGVIHGINPHVKIVDMTHNIQRHNIFEASQAILMSYKYFPSGTIHIVVVDPGVGSRRRPLLIATEHHFFIGPDNGVFSSIIDNAAVDFLKIYHITASHYFRNMEGSTFHGRDIFAPVGAWLSKGVDSGSLGEQINDCTKISIPEVALSENKYLTGEIVSIDNFGNAISNISKDDLYNLGPAQSEDVFRITFNNKKLPLAAYYADSKVHTLSAIINSFGYLELFVNKESAADTFDIKIGDKVSITR